MTTFKNAETLALHADPRMDPAISRQDSQPRFWSLLAIAFTPWQLLGRVMSERQTHAHLARLDDYMLKDIGISRGSIRSAIRDGRQ